MLGTHDGHSISIIALRNSDTGGVLLQPRRSHYVMRLAFDTVDATRSRTKSTSFNFSASVLLVSATMPLAAVICFLTASCAKRKAAWPAARAKEVSKLAWFTGDDHRRSFSAARHILNTWQPTGGQATGNDSLKKHSKNPKTFYMA